MQDVSDVIVHLQRFSWSDYLVFVCMLLLCIFIGIYFGFFEKKNSTESEYLVGDRNMKIFPIALSLVARWGLLVFEFVRRWCREIETILLCMRSFVSGITLLGLPTEVYSYGIQYVYVSGAVVLMGFIVGTVYLPVFHDLNITSTYEVKPSRADDILIFYQEFRFHVSSILSPLCCCSIWKSDLIVDCGCLAPLCLQLWTWVPSIVVSFCGMIFNCYSLPHRLHIYQLLCTFLHWRSIRVSLTQRTDPSNKLNLNPFRFCAH